MNVETTFTETKSLRSVVPGELVGLRLMSGRANAIATAVSNQMGGSLFIVLPPTVGVPSWVEISDDSQCMSFGCDWTLKLDDGDDVFPRNRTSVPDNGAIERQRDGSLIIAVSRHPADLHLGSSQMQIGMEKWVQASSMQADSIRFARWSIVLPKLSRPGHDFVIASVQATASP